MRLILYIFITAVVSNASVNVSDDKYIKDALLKYNYGIIKMGKSGETQFFKEFVKEDIAVKLQVWFESWKFSNLTYIANINDLRFSSITYNENNATIETMENWTFTYVNLDTKDYALKPMKIFYHMNYTLKKDGDIWKIIAVKNIKEELLENKKTHNPALKPKKEEPKENISTH